MTQSAIPLGFVEFWLVPGQQLDLQKVARDTDQTEESVFISALQLYAAAWVAAADGRNQIVYDNDVEASRTDCSWTHPGTIMEDVKESRSSKKYHVVTRHPIGAILTWLKRTAAAEDDGRAFRRALAMYTETVQRLQTGWCLNVITPGKRLCQCLFRACRCVADWRDRSLRDPVVAVFL